MKLTCRARTLKRINWSKVEEYINERREHRVTKHIRSYELRPKGVRVGTRGGDSSAVEAAMVEGRMEGAEEEGEEVESGERTTPEGDQKRKEQDVAGLGNRRAGSLGDCEDLPRPGREA